MEKKGTYYMTLAISRIDPQTPIILDAPDEIIQFFDGFFCEDNSFNDRWFKSVPLESGVYHCKVNFYFQQGYFEGYIAHGESDWEFVVISAEQKISFGKSFVSK